MKRERESKGLIKRQRGLVDSGGSEPLEPIAAIAEKRMDQGINSNVFLTCLPSLILFDMFQDSRNHTIEVWGL